MDRRTLLQSLVVLGTMGFRPLAEAATPLLVVVHPKNPVKGLGAGEIEAMFTTRKLDWSGGARVVPFNFPARHALREAFDARALHFNADEAARYWIDRRVRGGHPPPRQVGDARTMLRVVASLETAIGYLRKEDADGSVKIVAEL